MMAKVWLKFGQNFKLDLVEMFGLCVTKPLKLNVGQGFEVGGWLMF